MLWTYDDVEMLYVWTDSVSYEISGLTSALQTFLIMLFFTGCLLNPLRQLVYYTLKLNQMCQN